MKTRPDPLEGLASRTDLLAWIDKREVTPLVLVVTGSHMWGLVRPESDVDIRGIYLDDTNKVLSLHPGKDTIEAVGQLGGLVDIQLYEVKKAFNMLLANNGNLVEMLLSPTVFFEDSSFRIHWSGLASRFMTKRLAQYYLGYFHSQRKRAMANRGSKALVYTYREIMAGIWLMRTERIVHNFAALREQFCTVYGPLPLLEEYLDRNKWREPMSSGAIWEFEQEWKRLEEIMSAELEKSTLPQDPPDGMHDELNNLLLGMRKCNADSQRT